MKRISKLLFICIVSWTACFAQTTYVTPQTQVGTIFSAVFAAQNSGCLTNQGQNIWFSNYIVTGVVTNIQYRLEYSYNSDAATCNTGTWFAMSDDATDLSQGEVIGIGSYPFVRANLVQCGGCTVTTKTVTSFYSASSANPGILNGFYNASQQVRKVVFSNQSAASNITSASVPCPYGSTAGGVLFVAGATVTGSSFSVLANYGPSVATINSLTLAPYSSSGTPFFIPESASPCTSLKLVYTAGTATGNFFMFYYFTPPGSSVPATAQPPVASNSETVSAVNTPITVFAGSVGGTTENTYVFSVSGRCSAGTAQITINGATQLWSTGPTEVGTTTFRYQWNPGLLVGLGTFAAISMTTCGAGNTGTLDVQASVF